MGIRTGLLEYLTSMIGFSNTLANNKCFVRFFDKNFNIFHAHSLQVIINTNMKPLPKNKHFSCEINYINTGFKMISDDLRLETIRTAENFQKRGYQSHQVFGFLAGRSDHFASIFITSIYLAACPKELLYIQCAQEKY